MRVTLVDRLHARDGQCADLVQCDANQRLLVDKHTDMTAGVDRDLVQAAWQELDLYLTLQTNMAQLKKPSPHLLTLQTYHLQQGRLHRLHEYCERGDLLELLQRDRRMAVAGFATELTNDTICRLFTETLDAVATLHECGISHLDLSLENILLTEDLRVRVGDLGNAERFTMKKKKDRASVVLQRPRSLAKHAYAAPEMHSASLVDVTKADAWALGVILWTLWTKQPLLKTATLDDERFVLIKTKGISAALSEFSSAFAQAPVALKDLICRLLDVTAATRLSVREALGHPWLLQSCAKSVLFIQPRTGTSPVSVDSMPKRKTGECRNESVGGEIALEKTRISIRPSSITRARASSESQDSMPRHSIPIESAVHLVRAVIGRYEYMCLESHVRSKCETTASLCSVYSWRSRDAKLHSKGTDPRTQEESPTIESERRTGRMRRHYVFPEEETEQSIGDGKSNLLRLWLERRAKIMQHEQVGRYMLIFWDLAKAKDESTLSVGQYVDFFAHIAKALIESINNSSAAVIAQRDWLYDAQGVSMQQGVMTLELFREAFFQVAELILPIESETSMFVSFFLELRESIAVVDGQFMPSDNAHGGNGILHDATEPMQLTLRPSISTTQLYETVSYALRPLNDVTKIRGAFLQKMPPGGEQLKTIRGLQSPDSQRMSLKQLLLSYNPRKFSLSRKFSTMLHSEPEMDTINDISTTQREHAEAKDVVISRERYESGFPSAMTSSYSSEILNKESEDVWDDEEALIQSLQSFPALRIAVVGPPCSGKTRLSKSLAKRLTLRYFSLATAIEQAVERKKLRRSIQQEKIQAAEAAAIAAAIVDIALEEPRESDSETVTKPEISKKEPNTDAIAPEQPHEEDLLFSDEDFDDLYSGRSMHPSKALKLLLYYAAQSLLEGVGIVIDDVHPFKLETSIRLDYLVSLSISLDDIERHLQQFRICPTSKNIYSARELALIRSSGENIVLINEQGFGDALIPEVNDSTLVQESPPQAIVSEPIEGDENDQAETPADTSSSNDENEVSKNELPPPEPTPMDKNEIDPPVEDTFPVHLLMLEYFLDRYKSYVDRAQAMLDDASRAPESGENFKSSPGVHMISVLAMQSLCMIREQCVQAITGNHMGVSRSNTSRLALPIVLPEDQLRASRAEQIRWLLYGDWISSPPSVSIHDSKREFGRLPSTISRYRRLSKWRQFCPVTSNSDVGLTVGDPNFAVFYSGRIYLFATASAREFFCAHPLQFLLKKPIQKELKKIWLISTVALAPYAERFEQLTTANVFPATQILSSHLPMAVEMELMEGKSLSSATAVNVIADAMLHAQSTAKWVLCDLPLTVDSLNALKEINLLPEIVIYMDTDETLLRQEVSKSGGGVLVSIKNEQLKSQVAPGTPLIQAVREAGVAFEICPMYEDVSDTMEALRRLIDPLASRVDRVNDGYLLPEDAASVFSIPTGDEEDDAPSRRQKMGETAHFCPVSWCRKQVLVSGTPKFVSAFDFKYYAFAGKQEQEAFERNPDKYIPLAPDATASLIPLIMILGVRGSQRRQIMVTLENLINKSFTMIKIDEYKVLQSLSRRLQIEMLKGEAQQVQEPQLYVDVAIDHMHTAIAASPNNGKPPIVLISKIGSDESRLPSTELLELCIRNNLCPTLVLPLEIAEDKLLDRRIRQWKENLTPPKRSKMTNPNGSNEDAEQEPEFSIEEARAEEMQRLQEQFQSDSETMSAALDMIRARGIAVSPSIDVSGTLRESVKKTKAEIESFMRRKASLFESCEILEREKAIEILLTGEAMIGKHNTGWPALNTGRRLSPSSASIHQHSVLYRRRVYFPGSQDDITRFMTEPSKFLGEASVSPEHQITCAITGAPATGKTSLAKALASRFNLVYLSPQSSIDWVLQCYGGTAIWEELHVATTAGVEVSDIAIHTAICLRIQSSECQQRGWVLDDYLLHATALHHCTQPRTLVQPAILIILDGNFQRIWELKKAAHGAGQDNDAEIHSIALSNENAAREELIAAFSKWQKQRLDLIGYWTTTFGAFHLQQLDTSHVSFWKVCAQAERRLEDHDNRVCRYRKKLVAGQAARIYGVLRSAAILQAQVHPIFQAFCPVELSQSRYHESCMSDRSYCVEYKGHCFWFANELNVKQFEEQPEEYVGDDAEQEAQRLMQKMPVDASLLSLLAVPDCDFPELKGYCPVSYALGTGASDWSALVKGQIFFRASYQHKVYFFASESMRRRFLTEPRRFVSQSLPIKLPPQVSVALAKNYPGKLEQELSTVLNESLLRLGSERPKFLQINVSASACVYLALILKTQATSLSEAVKAQYMARKKAFECDCSLGEMLKGAITPNNASCGTAVKGVRAVRVKENVQFSRSETDLLKICNRFDAIVHSRQNLCFLEYCKPNDRSLGP